MKNIKETIQIITSGTAQVVPMSDLQKKIESGKKLIIKLGADPTAPDLHLGHAVVLLKLKQLQDLGHNIVFLIGDFTAHIGDPTGKSKTRPSLSQEEIKNNTKTYFEQVSKILDPKNMTVAYNSQWLDKLSSKDLVQLCSKVTLARLIEREDFSTRIKKQQALGFHELLYPLFQAYDSVHMEADIEIGGTDQTFNLLLGRFLQEQYKKEPQVVLTMPILEGLDGVQKMSKSLGNSIGLAQPADQAFGKLMSISDKLMWRYFELLLHAGTKEISELQERIAAGSLHPMSLKKEMAHNIIEKFWSQQEAKSAKESFEALFQKKDYSKAKEVNISSETPNPLWIVALLRALKAINSSSEARRLIQAGAVSIDGEVVSDFKAEITWKQGTTVKVGKHRIYKLI
ncbi:tyrosine--tRNA ligase [bacterium]|nr:tyrosine--tRNA ligase [bacterium]